MSSILSNCKKIIKMIVSITTHEMSSFWHFKQTFFALKGEAAFDKFFICIWAAEKSLERWTQSSGGKRTKREYKLSTFKDLI